MIIAVYRVDRDDQDPRETKLDLVARNWIEDVEIGPIPAQLPNGGDSAT